MTIPYPHYPAPRALTRLVLGKPIVTEGERGLVFYIIVSGIADVHKDGIGNVAQLVKGACHTTSFHDSTRPLSATRFVI